MNKYYFVGIPKKAKHGFDDLDKYLLSISAKKDPEALYTWIIESGDSLALMFSKIKIYLERSYDFIVIEDKSPNPRFHGCPKEFFSFLEKRRKDENEIPLDKFLETSELFLEGEFRSRSLRV